MTPMHYRLELQETNASTGYFAPIPQKARSLEKSVAYLRRHPNDTFMHNHVLGFIGAMDVDAAERFLDTEAAEDPIVRALLFEAVLLYGHLA